MDDDGRVQPQSSSSGIINKKRKRNKKKKKVSVNSGLSNVDKTIEKSNLKSTKAKTQFKGKNMQERIKQLPLREDHQSFVGNKEEKKNDDFQYITVNKKEKQTKPKSNQKDKKIGNSSNEAKNLEQKLLDKGSQIKAGKSKVNLMPVEETNSKVKRKRRRRKKKINIIQPSNDVQNVDEKTKVNDKNKMIELNPTEEKDKDNERQLFLGTILKNEAEDNDSCCSGKSMEKQKNNVDQLLCDAILLGEKDETVSYQQPDGITQMKENVDKILTGADDCPFKFNSLLYRAAESKGCGWIPDGLLLEGKKEKNITINNEETREDENYEDLQHYYDLIQNKDKVEKNSNNSITSDLTQIAGKEEKNTDNDISEPVWMEENPKSDNYCLDKLAFFEGIKVKEKVKHQIQNKLPQTVENYNCDAIGEIIQTKDKCELNKNSEMNIDDQNFDETIELAMRKESSNDQFVQEISLLDLVKDDCQSASKIQQIEEEVTIRYENKEKDVQEIQNELPQTMENNNCDAIGEIIQTKDKYELSKNLEMNIDDQNFDETIELPMRKESSNDQFVQEISLLDLVKDDCQSASKTQQIEEEEVTIRYENKEKDVQEIQNELPQTMENYNCDAIGEIIQTKDKYELNKNSEMNIDDQNFDETIELAMRKESSNDQFVQEISLLDLVKDDCQSASKTQQIEEEEVTIRYENKEKDVQEIQNELPQTMENYNCDAIGEIIQTKDKYELNKNSEMNIDDQNFDETIELAMRKESSNDQFVQEISLLDLVKDDCQSASKTQQIEEEEEVTIRYENKEKDVQEIQNELPQTMENYNCDAIGEIIQTKDKYELNKNSEMNIDDQNFDETIELAMRKESSNDQFVQEISLLDLVKDDCQSASKTQQIEEEEVTIRYENKEKDVQEIQNELPRTMENYNCDAIGEIIQTKDKYELNKNSEMNIDDQNFDETIELAMRKESSNDQFVQEISLLDLVKDDCQSASKTQQIEEEEEVTIRYENKEKDVQEIQNELPQTMENYNCDAIGEIIQTKDKYELNKNSEMNIDDQNFDETIELAMRKESSNDQFVQEISLLDLVKDDCQSASKTQQIEEEEVTIRYENKEKDVQEIQNELPRTMENYNCDAIGEIIQTKDKYELNKNSEMNIDDQNFDETIELAMRKESSNDQFVQEISLLDLVKDDCQSASKTQQIEEEEEVTIRYENKEKDVQEIQNELPQTMENYNCDAIGEIIQTKDKYELNKNSEMNIDDQNFDETIELPMRKESSNDQFVQEISLLDLVKDDCQSASKTQQIEEEEVTIRYENKEKDVQEIQNELPQTMENYNCDAIGEIIQTKDKYELNKNLEMNIDDQNFDETIELAMRKESSNDQFVQEISLLDLVKDDCQSASKIQQIEEEEEVTIRYENKEKDVQEVQNELPQTMENYNCDAIGEIIQTKDKYELNKNLEMNIDDQNFDETIELAMRKESSNDQFVQEISLLDLVKDDCQSASKIQQIEEEEVTIRYENKEKDVQEIQNELPQTMENYNCDAIGEIIQTKDKYELNKNLEMNIDDQNFDETIELAMRKESSNDQFVQEISLLDLVKDDCQSASKIQQIEEEEVTIRYENKEKDVQEIQNELPQTMENYNCDAIGEIIQTKDKYELNKNLEMNIDDQNFSETIELAMRKESSNDQFVQEISLLDLVKDDCQSASKTQQIEEEEEVTIRTENKEKDVQEIQNELPQTMENYNCDAIGEIIQTKDKYELNKNLEMNIDDQNFDETTELAMRKESSNDQFVQEISLLDLVKDDCQSASKTQQIEEEEEVTIRTENKEKDVQEIQNELPQTMENYNCDAIGEIIQTKDKYELNKNSEMNIDDQNFDETIELPMRKESSNDQFVQEISLLDLVKDDCQSASKTQQIEEEEEVTIRTENKEKDVQETQNELPQTMENYNCDAIGEIIQTKGKCELNKNLEMYIDDQNFDETIELAMRKESSNDQFVQEISLLDLVKDDCQSASKTQQIEEEEEVTIQYENNNAEIEKESSSFPGEQSFAYSTKLIDELNKDKKSDESEGTIIKCKHQKRKEKIIQFLGLNQDQMKDDIKGQSTNIISTETAREITNKLSNRNSLCKTETVQLEKQSFVRSVKMGEIKKDNIIVQLTVESNNSKKKKNKVNKPQKAEIDKNIVVGQSTFTDEQINEEIKENIIFDKKSKQVVSYFNFMMEVFKEEQLRISAKKKKWPSLLKNAMKLIMKRSENKYESAKQSALDFGLAELRCAYIYINLTCDIEIIRKFLGWSRQIIPLNFNSTFHVCSIGNGPGSDILSLLKFAQEDVRFKDKKIIAHVIDLYGDWKKIIEKIKKKLYPDDKCSVIYQKCNFYKKKKHRNRLFPWQDAGYIFQTVASADLVMMVKIVSSVLTTENHNVWKENFKEMITRMKTDSVLFFVDSAQGEYLKFMETISTECGLIERYFIENCEFNLMSPEHLHLLEVYKEEFDGIVPKTKDKLAFAVWKKKEITIKSPKQIQKMEQNPNNILSCFNFMMEVFKDEQLRISAKKKKWPSLLIPAMKLIMKRSENKYESSKQSASDFGLAELRCAYIYINLTYDIEIIRKFLGSSRQIIPLNFNSTFQVCSIGNGPGSDILSLLKLAQEDVRFKDKVIIAHVIDLYGDWKAIIEKIKKKLYPDDKCSVIYQKCNFLKDAEYIFQTVASADLVMMVKIVSSVLTTENHNVWKKNFKEMITRMKTDSVLFFVDIAQGEYLKFMETISAECGLTALYFMENYEFDLMSPEHLHLLEVYKEEFDGIVPKTKDKLTFAVWKKKEIAIKSPQQIQKMEQNPNNIVSCFNFMMEVFKEEQFRISAKKIKWPSLLITAMKLIMKLSENKYESSKQPALDFQLAELRCAYIYINLTYDIEIIRKILGSSRQIIPLNFNSTFQVCSIGNGPGSDIFSLLKLAQEDVRFKDKEIIAHVIDLYGDWKAIIEKLKKKLYPVDKCSVIYQKCNYLKKKKNRVFPLQYAEFIFHKVASADLVMMVKIVSSVLTTENHNVWKKNFKEMITRMKTDSVLFFVDIAQGEYLKFMETISAECGLTALYFIENYEFDLMSPEHLHLLEVYKEEFDGIVPKTKDKLTFAVWKKKEIAIKSPQQIQKMEQNPNNVSDEVNLIIHHIMEVIEEEKKSWKGKVLDPTTAITNALGSMMKLYSIGNSKSHIQRPINFSVPQYRCGYLYKFVTCHVQYIRNYLHKIEAVIKANLQNKNQFFVCSIGGGPGSDLFGVMEFLRHTTWWENKELIAGIFDIHNWQNTFRKLRKRLDPDQKYLSKTFYKCCNMLKIPDDALVFISSADLVMMIKFLTEVLTPEVHDECKRTLMEIFTEMKPNSLFFFIDNTGGGCLDLIKEIAEECKMRNILLKRWESFSLEEKLNPESRFYHQVFGKIAPQISCKLAVAVWQKQSEPEHLTLNINEPVFDQTQPIDNSAKQYDTIVKKEILNNPNFAVFKDILLSDLRKKELQNSCNDIRIVLPENMGDINSEIYKDDILLTASDIEVNDLQKTFDTCVSQPNFFQKLYLTEKNQMQGKTNVEESKSLAENALHLKYEENFPENRKLSENPIKIEKLTSQIVTDEIFTDNIPSMDLTLASELNVTSDYMNKSIECVHNNSIIDITSKTINNVNDMERLSNIMKVHDPVKRHFSHDQDAQKEPELSDVTRNDKTFDTFNALSIHSSESKDSSANDILDIDISSQVQNNFINSQEAVTIQKNNQPLEQILFSREELFDIREKLMFNLRCCSELQYKLECFILHSIENDLKLTYSLTNNKRQRCDVINFRIRNETKRILENFNLNIEALAWINCLIRLLPDERINMLDIVPTDIIGHIKQLTHYNKENTPTGMIQSESDQTNKSTSNSVNEFQQMETKTSEAKKQIEAKTKLSCEEISIGHTSSGNEDCQMEPYFQEIHNTTEISKQCIADRLFRPVRVTKISSFSQDGSLMLQNCSLLEYCFISTIVENSQIDLSCLFLFLSFRELLFWQSITKTNFYHPFSITRQAIDLRRWRFGWERVFTSFLFGKLYKFILF